MIHFVGAGPGAEDLITVRGQRYLEQADVVIYAGSLVNPGLLKSTKETCEIYNSAKMTLEEVLEVMKQILVTPQSASQARWHGFSPICFSFRRTCTAQKRFVLFLRKMRR